MFTIDHNLNHRTVSSGHYNCFPDNYHKLAYLGLKCNLITSNITIIILYIWPSRLLTLSITYNISYDIILLYIMEPHIYNTQTILKKNKLLLQQNFKFMTFIEGSLKTSRWFIWRFQEPVWFAAWSVSGSCPRRFAV